MTAKDFYDIEYKSKKAILVGINKYENASPLLYAKNDAEIIGKVLVEHLGYASSEVSILVDEDATKKNIEEHIASLISCDPETSILLFFAGHGGTLPGHTGDEGFFVPVEGNIDDKSSLLFWRQVTKIYSDLIPAKHILFIIDSCFGGTAFKRKTSPGSQRFLEDCLKRYSRQLFTSGKRDQEVADGNGPLPSNSIFTGYLYEALSGKVEKDGITHANAVMQYVYNQVSQNDLSEQTPHFGNIQGDGNFLFKFPNLKQESTEKVFKPHLIQTPYENPLDLDKDSIELFIEKLETNISDQQSRIKLDRQINLEVKTLCAFLSSESFATDTSLEKESIVKRFREYELASKKMIHASLILGKWAKKEHYSLISNFLSRIHETTYSESSGSQYILLMRMKWFPIELLLYSLGIGAVAEGNYDLLNEVFSTKVLTKYNGYKNIIIDLLESTSERQNFDEVFKLIPGHEKQFTPRSEFIFEILQNHVEETLYLGRNYEFFFDRFETIFALTYSYIYESESVEELVIPEDHQLVVRTIPSRFSYKYKRHSNTNPYKDLLTDATAKKENWEPIKAGLFGGKYNNFAYIAEGVLNNINSRSFI